MTAIPNASTMIPVPDILLPVQLQYRSPTRPEEQLMLAVLEDALACFQRGAFAVDIAGRNRFDDVCDWIFAGDHDWPFSFENICEGLSIDPAYVREALARWTRRVPPPLVEHPVAAMRRMKNPLAFLHNTGTTPGARGASRPESRNTAAVVSRRRDMRPRGRIRSDGTQRR